MVDCLNSSIPVGQPHICNDNDGNEIGKVYNWMAVRSLGPNLLGDTTFCDDVTFIKNPEGIEHYGFQCYIPANETIVNGFGDGTWKVMGEPNLGAARTWDVKFSESPANTANPIFVGPIGALVGGANVGLIAIGNGDLKQRTIVAKFTFTGTLEAIELDGQTHMLVNYGLVLSNIGDTPRDPSYQETSVLGSGEAGRVNVTSELLCALPFGQYVNVNWATATGQQFDWINANITADFYGFSNLDSLPVNTIAKPTP